MFLAFILLLACAWGAVTYLMHRQLAEDQAARAADAEAFKQWQAAAEPALRDLKQGKLTPLPSFPQNDEAAQRESSKRWPGYMEYFLARGLIELVLYFSVLGAAITLGIWHEITRRRMMALDRPAAPNAGYLVNDFIAAKRMLVATCGGTQAPEIHVDGQRALIVFRGYRFIQSFVGNRMRENTEVPFADVLAAHILLGSPNFLQLRTTQGTVVIGRDVSGFETLSELMFDLVEVNRRSPEKYRAARAREPVVHIPWYGWLIIVAALAGVTWGFWYFAIA